MGWEQDNRDYAKERGINISPFRTVYSFTKFVYNAATLLGTIPLAIALRSLWVAAVLILWLLFTVNSQHFKFMWDSAPWFRTLIGQTVLVLTPIALVVIVWPLPWLGLIGYLAAGIFGLAYHKECKTLVREFNVPEREL